MRITNQYTNSTFANSTAAAMAKLLKVQQQIVSGKKIDNASEDPMSAVQILNMNTQMYKLEDWMKNAAKAKEDAGNSYDTLSLFEKQLQAIDSLAIQAANGGSSEETLLALKTELQGRTKTLVNIANTKYGDSYIFAGTNTQTPPYVLNDDMSVTYQGTESTANWQRKAEIFEGEEVTLNVLGQNIFGDDKSGVFATLKNLNDAFEATPPDISAIRGELDNLKKGLSSVSGAMSGLSSTTTHLKSIEELNQGIYDNVTEARSAIRDTDVTQASSDLAMAQSALEASLKITAAMLNRPSLLDYI